MSTGVASAMAVLSVLLWSTSWAEMGNSARPLKAAPGSKAEGHIDKGIEHYNRGTWDVAKMHFSAAEEADPQSAEAYYDVGLVLDKMGDHRNATQHFKKAYELGKNNPDIQKSTILKKYVNVRHSALRKSQTVEALPQAESPITNGQ